MAFEVPADLIRQVQISLRTDAGLSTYDPHDPTLPPLPSVDASIASFDPSTPAYLRCKNCKGKLLRGIQSLICIYCGKQQLNKDFPPDPISFSSTFGYQWLLQSLGLDQSETVGPSPEESDSNRGQSTSKQETTLHDLLDLQITWSDESEKTETSVSIKTLEQNSRSLNLNGADLDNIFSGSKRDPVYNESAGPVTENQIESSESKASAGQENLSLFSSVPSVDPAVRSSEDNSGDSFSGWAADFQSADKQDEPKSFDPFIGSSVDLSSHIDSVFGPGKEEKSRKLEDDSGAASSMTYDWMQDDLWGNVNSKVSRQAEPFDLSAEAKDGPKPDVLENPSSEVVDWFGDNQWKTNTASTPSNKIISEPDDSFDEWNDFTSSSRALGTSGNAWKENDDTKVTSTDHSSEINLFSSTSNLEDNKFGSFSQPNLFSGSPIIQDAGAVSNNNLFEIFTSDRINNASNVEEAQETTGIVFSTTTSPKDEVDILMSQMHDLSFMLESNLSIPSKLDGRTSTRQD